MSPKDCNSEDRYLSEKGICCDRCEAGKYVKAECDNTQETQCAECRRGFYMATKNHLKSCHMCKDCNSNNNQKNVMECTDQEDTVCGCVSGFYCNDADCDHCRPVRHCPPGEGVKVQASRTNDTICVPCENGTYSNVSDFHSPCKTHTRCEDIGRVLQIPGTAKTDATCGNFKTHCHWILPAGLWSGLVLTALILFAVIICRRMKRKSYKASSSRPVTLVEMVPAPESPLELPLPPTQLNGHGQESYTLDTCELPLFKPDDVTVSYCTQHSVESSLPITPLKASVSFAESNHMNGSNRYCSVNFLRTHSEPQEDEWCGT